MKRFTKPHFLKQIGRELLGQFWGRFEPELMARNIPRPGPELDDAAYFERVAQIAMRPEGLPDNLVEAAHAIEAMANEEGQERLERAVAEGELHHLLDGDNSPADLAMKVWLADPVLLAEKCNELRLARLTGFDYFGSKAPVDRSGSFAAPDAATMERLTRDLEEAFQKRNRGQQTVQVSVHAMDGEWWFIVVHGDSFARVPTIDAGRVVVRHFRPAKDDVVVYNPERDELRLHAGTKWERDLYRTCVGTRLFGDDAYFSERKNYSLETLVSTGADALDVSDIAGFVRVVLREYEVAWHGQFNDGEVRKSDDIFASAEARGRMALPIGGRITRAVFDVYFEGAKKPRKVQIRPPNVLKLSRRCDAALVERWLAARGFLVITNRQGESGHGDAVAVS